MLIQEQNRIAVCDCGMHGAIATGDGKRYKFFSKVEAVNELARLRKERVLLGSEFAFLLAQVPRFLDLPDMDGRVNDAGLIFCGLSEEKSFLKPSAKVGSDNYKSIFNLIVDQSDTIH
jgi:hypothetical protein